MMTNEKLINYLFRNYNNDTSVLSTYKCLNIDKSTLLADLIYDNETDKLQFLKQYLKLFNKNDEKRLVK